MAYGSLEQPFEVVVDNRNGFNSEKMRNRRKKSLIIGISFSLFLVALLIGTVYVGRRQATISQEDDFFGEDGGTNDGFGLKPPQSVSNKPFASLHPYHPDLDMPADIDDVTKEIQSVKDSVRLPSGVLQNLQLARRAQEEVRREEGEATHFLQQPAPPPKPNADDPDAPPVYRYDRDPTQRHE